MNYFKVLNLNNRHRGEVLSKDLYIDQSRTRRLAVEIGYFESYRYAQLQNRELKTELARVSHLIIHMRTHHERERERVRERNTNVTNLFV
jgi:hypothetical protein